MSDLSMHLRTIQDVGLMYPYYQNRNCLQNGVLPTHWFPRMMRVYSWVWSAIARWFANYEDWCDPEAAEWKRAHHFGSQEPFSRLNS